MKSKNDPPKNFTPIMQLIFKGLWKIPYFGEALTKIYVKAWNPINYAIIGGIGVLINMALLGSTLPYMPWFISNIIAIGCAWLWNWINAVGPLCHHWGFKRQDK
jgi:hypothetical protein